VLMYGDNNL